MKKIIVITVLSALVGFSCAERSKGRTAQLLIKEMLASTMFYPKSYEGVSFGTLDSLYSHVEEDSIYAASKNALKNFVAQKARINKALAQNARTIDNLDRINGIAVYYPWLEEKRRELNWQLKKCNLQIDSFQQKVDSIELHFNPVFIGYTMEHRFKYLGRGGYAMENAALFYLDPDINIVTKFKDDLGLLFEYNPSTNKYEPK